MNEFAATPPAATSTLAPALLHGEHRARDELVDNGLREVARKRRTVELLSRLLGVVGKVYDGGLEA